MDIKKIISRIELLPVELQVQIYDELTIQELRKLHKFKHIKILPLIKVYRFLKSLGIELTEENVYEELYNKFYDEITEGNLDIVKNIIENVKGIELNDAALLYAVEANHVDIVKYLVENFPYIDYNEDAIISEFLGGVKEFGGNRVELIKYLVDKNLIDLHIHKDNLEKYRYIYDPETREYLISLGFIDDDSDLEEENLSDEDHFH